MWAVNSGSTSRELCTSAVTALLRLLFERNKGSVAPTFVKRNPKGIFHTRATTFWEPYQWRLKPVVMPLQKGYLTPYSLGPLVFKREGPFLKQGETVYGARFNKVASFPFLVPLCSKPKGNPKCLCASIGPSLYYRRGRSEFSNAADFTFSGERPDVCPQQVNTA